MEDENGLNATDRLHAGLEPLAQKRFVYPEGDALTASIAISLKRIADTLAGDPERGDFLAQLFNVLGDASHNHAQRMNP